MLDFIILGCLKIKDMTGYEIKKTMSFSTTFFTNVNDGNMYPTLKRLLEQGAVAVREETENGRHKKVYAITPEGEARLAGWLEQPLDPMVFKYEMLVRLFFARNLEAPALIRLLAQHVAQIEQLSASLQVVEQGVGKKGEIGRAHV